ncbi:MAG: TIGR04283 family arsenosugar biosynthesis glycosyltransferase [Candidatus Sumerlaeaceae bacterium]
MSRAPRISIIIPTRNEEQAITSLLRSLSRQDRIDDCQVIVVDGNSSDDTAELASAFPFVQVLSTTPGLVPQMNFGAQMANAEILWFVHADTTLPNRATIDSIVQAMADPEVVGGACRFHLRGDDLYFKFVNSLVNLRARVLGRPYGDQGIFARTAAFRKIGGFRPLSSCADIDFVMRLRREGSIRVVPARVETSARTWHRYGKITTTVWHLKEWLAFEWDRLFRSGKASDLQVQPLQEPTKKTS